MNETRTVKKILRKNYEEGEEERDLDSCGLKTWKKIEGMWVSTDGESKRWIELKGHQL
jgi:hypothetical protein